jgi:hypothetical protein
MKTSSWQPQQGVELLKLTQALVLSVDRGNALQLPALSVIHLSLKLLRAKKGFVVRTLEGVIVYEFRDGKSRGWEDFGAALGAYDYLMQEERKDVVEEVLRMQAALQEQEPPTQGASTRGASEAAEKAPNAD